MRSRTTAALLALFGGVIGMHYFYLGKTGLGIMSIVFLMMGWIPVNIAIGVVNFLILIGMSDQEFMKRYNRDEWRDQKRRQQSDTMSDADYQRAAEERRRQERANREARDRMNPQPASQTERMDIGQKETFKQNGLRKYKEFDYDGAIEEFVKALSVDNRDMAIHWNLACLYSLTEQKELGFYHLQCAVETGFRDYEKVKTHDALAFLRVQPEFDAFAQNGLRLSESMEHSDILQQLRALQNQRERGVLTAKEFAEKTKRLAEEW